MHIHEFAQTAHGDGHHIVVGGTPVKIWSGFGELLNYMMTDANGLSSCLGRPKALRSSRHERQSIKSSIIEMAVKSSITEMVNHH